MLLAKLQSDLKLALKAKEELRVSVIRLILSALNYEQIEKQHDLSTEEITTVLLRDAKKHRESITSFKKGKREDLWRKEEQELEIIQSYLPKQISSKALKAEVSSIVSALNPADKKNFGKVMGMVMAKLKGKADGSVIAGVVKELLSNSRITEF